MSNQCSPGLNTVLAAEPSARHTATLRCGEYIFNGSLWETRIFITIKWERRSKFEKKKPIINLTDTTLSHTKHASIWFFWISFEIHCRLTSNTTYKSVFLKSNELNIFQKRFSLNISNFQLTFKIFLYC